MKPYNKKPVADKEVAGIPEKKRKDKRIWQLEFKWISEKDFNTHPKTWGIRKTEVFTTEWTSAGIFTKFMSPESALSSIKKDLRSTFSSRYIKGREWRVKNIYTNETVEFPDIQNFYND